MKSTPDDYLKFWRVIRYYMIAKHKITQAEIEIILFLYSEKYFNKDRFDEFNELLSWDIGRFSRLLRDGWIQVFRKGGRGRKAVYQLSDKSVNLVRDIYRKLSGEEIPTSLSYNPMFAKNVCYTDKVYRNMIKEMNKFIRQQRHQTPE
jgi:hypothetical protein